MQSLGERTQSYTESFYFRTSRVWHVYKECFTIVLHQTEYVNAIESVCIPKERSARAGDTFTET